MNSNRRRCCGSASAEAGEGKICYVKTEDNAADALTKPLERGRFSKHRSYLLGMVDVEQLTRERELAGVHAKQLEDSRDGELDAGTGEQDRQVKG